MVDDYDFDQVSKYKWRVLVFRHSCYAIAHIPDADHPSGRRAVYLHRFILDLPKGRQPEVDHINHDGLDCRRSNMRICSRSENQRNSRFRGKNKSGFLGVFASGNRWYASVQVNGIRYESDRFECVIDAAKAHDVLALRHHGSYAQLNFPDAFAEEAA